MEQLYFWLAGSNFALSNPKDGRFKDEMKLYRNNFASAYPPPISPIKQKNKTGSNFAFRNSGSESKDGLNGGLRV